MSHTLAIMTVSPETFGEIKAKLLEADYKHAILDDGCLLDLHDIGIQKHGKVETLKEMEKRAITAAFVRHGGKVAEAARELGIGRATLYRRLNNLGLR